jgi:hypothetical protein
VNDDSLTREQALLMLTEHVGERVRLALCLEATDEMPLLPAIAVQGELSRPQDQHPIPVAPQERDVLGVLFTVGGQIVCLPPLPGTIRERPNGLDFELTDVLTLSVAWPGPDGE